LKNLRPFVTAVIDAHESIQEGCLTIDQVVFEPKKLNALLAKYSLPVQARRDWSMVASGREEAAELLEAALSDWVDFVFIPEPKPFAIYADHDEYVTFFASTKSNLNSVADPLSAQGFKSVQGYERKL